MLTKKQILVLFVLSLIPLTFYLTREDILGFDGYHFLSYVCEDNYVPNGTIDKTPILSVFIFSIFPCSIIAVKIFLCFLLFLSTVIIAHMGQLFHKKNGWLAGIFVYLSLLFPMEFLKFEDDQLAFPILFLAMYFFLRGITERNRKHQALAFVLVLLVGILLWKGAIVYVFAFAMFYPIVFLSAIILSNVSPDYNFFGSIFPDWSNFLNLAIENYPLVGLALTGILGWAYLWVEPMLLYPIIFFSILALLKAQLAIHLIPLLAISFVNKFKASKDVLKVYFVAAAIFILFYSSLSIPNQFPTVEEKMAAITAVGYSKEINNDWSIGYLVEYYGGIPKYTSGGFPEYDFSNGIALTTTWLDECELLDEFKRYKIYRCD